MLQEIYNETEAAAQEIVDAVVPAASEATKEDIAEASVDKAEAIADAVDAVTTESTGTPLDEATYSELLETTAQVIYTNVMSDLASMQSCYALESLFSDEEVEECYAAMDEGQDIYGERWDKIKGHFNRNKQHYIAGGASAAVGAAGGALIGRRVAAKRGISKRKGALIGALAGATVGGATGVGGSFAYNKWGRKK